jgi:sugar diacid utilization regulator
VQVLELRVADRVVGWMRVRRRPDAPDPSFLRLVATLVASEVDRVRAPDRESAAAAHSFVRALLGGSLAAPADILARARELGVDLDRGASVLVCRAHPLAPAVEDWRARFLLVSERAARALAPGAIAVARDERPAGGAEILVLLPDPDGTVGARAAEGVRRDLEAGLPGFAFAVGRSTAGLTPAELRRAGNEAVLAANLAEAGREDRAVVAFEDTGAYRLLLRAMSEDPRELQRFYSETLEPVVAYDEQYETDLVQTLETFLEADGNVAATAQRLYTHRHTVRYRLERVRELCGHDVGSTDGREKLGLGLKAMRVLGIPSPHGPATEAGAEAGRVPRESKDRR